MKNRAFNRLQRVLELEKQQTYRNKAVVGGIRQFSKFWEGQARQEAIDAADEALIDEIVGQLGEYGRLPNTDARAAAIQSLLSKIDQRRARLQGVQSPDASEPSPVEPEPVEDPSPPAETAQESTPMAKKEARRARQPAEAEEEATSGWANLPRIKMETAVPDPEGLAQSVTVLKGVGPKVAELLEKLDVSTMQDLLYLYPRRYDDYTQMKPIQQLQYGEQVTIIGTIWETRARRSRNNQIVVQSVISDGTAKVQATWFNQPWLADKLKANMQVVISGTVDQYLGRLVFNAPEWEPLEYEPLKTRRIVPVYPLTQGLSSNRLRDWVRTAVIEWAPKIPDYLPQTIRQKHNLFTLPQAISQIHFPESQQALHHARRRLVFDEHFLLQLGMQTQRQMWQTIPATPIPNEPVHVVRFQNALPFDLTAAQSRVIAEISADMDRDIPMNRLLQGDVGAGKTVVAAAALVQAVKSGMQAALMAPTEILAEQHFNSLHSLLTPMDVTVSLLTGSTPAAEKQQIYQRLADGSIDIAIGTHALIQEGVSFQALGLAIVDEQHRFGVDQRQALRQKGNLVNGQPHTPHLLVMSATPIPRSLALSLYGDLDLSILDEMPPGRQEIRTRWLKNSDRERGYMFVRRQIEQGRQAYIIYPLVEESDKIDARSAVEEYERLQQAVFPNARVGLIHGRLRADEKEAAMRAFYAGETDILVSTTVIEVGVDVPNATVMMVDGANRFGLAQLHQLRGRVGRGQHQSYCLLISDGETAVAEERLTAIEQTNDGFALAEKDLEIRGPGEFFGRRQSGLPELHLASLLDMTMLEMTQAEAKALIAQDPDLADEAHQPLKERMARFWETAADIS